MQSVCICKSCGRTIDMDFLYCPWCGESRIEQAVKEANLDSIFTRLEQLQVQDKVKHIQKLDAELAELERDLETIALSVEMHK
ncbi:MAG: hypothetical protein J6B32_01340 [Spirochaetaceae bacterium]|nr:hypothetical protein [Spirochaetaceae bacterium]MBO5235742.1 hypothetical protein [Spirochaetaceae bacterium]